ncbi:GNAT family N-acetyltransferase [Nocardia farcinica]|uniref:GNAT family N-acetyltransferase n=1 Tax=Nocardia farcinica TaxID=37329 RepID=UPI002458A032|nr:GNAT family N-acetyltransferase [Nocardia farcinica]
MSTEVRINPTLERFEIFVDGDLAGYAEYQDTASERAFVHTEIHPGYEHRGYAKQLVGAALSASRAEGFGVLPLCPMVRHFVETHTEYIASVPQWARQRMGLPQ